MQLVYAKLSYSVLSWPGFFEKLQQYIGEFRIEGQSLDDVANKKVTISFMTDKVKISEGKPRQVEFTAQRKGMAIDNDGFVTDDWEFLKIEAVY